MLLGSSSLLLGCDKSTSDVQTSNVPEVRHAVLHSANQADIDNIAANLDVKYQVVTNIPSQKCDKKIANGLCFEVQLSFTAKTDIQAKDWNIHFSQILPAQSFDSKEFAIEHINGDLHKLSLNEQFNGFKQGETKTLVFRSLYWSLSEWDAMPNYIVSAENSEAKVIESTRPKIDLATGLETLPYVVPFTDYQKQFKRTAGDSTQWLNSEILFARNEKLGTKKPPTQTSRRSEFQDV